MKGVETETGLKTKSIFSERVQTRAVLASDDYVELWMLKKAWKVQGFEGSFC